MKHILLSLLAFLIFNLTQAQKVGIGTLTPVAKLDIRGVSSAPAIPSATSNGIIRLGVSPIEGIDIGKQLSPPYSAWIQAGYNGVETDPVSLQPLGGNVSIGIIGPEISAALDVHSTSQGFLPPRLTSAQRGGIANPVAGLMIWCSNCGVSGEVQVHNGSAWTNMMGGTPALAIGDPYGGGVVAYILQPGDSGYTPGVLHGIIAAPFDQTNGSQWGCPGTNIQGADNQLVGCGLQNTIDIVNGCATAGIAARKCNDLVLNGYSDWYLPGKEELYKLSLNHEVIGGFEDATYWSSSEADTNTAWEQFMFSGFQCNGHKANADHVRAVRSF